MRIDLAAQLGEYILTNSAEWQEAKQKASLTNAWFTPEFIDLATGNIAKNFLDKQKLETWALSYEIKNGEPKKIGIVMAGNIPLVGFHDFLCVFASGHKSIIKASSKDEILIKHLVQKLMDWNKELNALMVFQEMLKGCDAYIATGSNNSARYFEYYFKKYPHIIRRNRTSVAVLDGNETIAELEKLSDDVHLYFGMGCRNVTKIFVPKAYDFIPMLSAFKKYDHFKDHNKYKNNYDYNLALHILNGKFYMANESIILFENPSIFSPISQLNYEFYTDKKVVTESLRTLNDVQCAVGHDYIPFGQAQLPSLTDHADGIDTMNFLTKL
ncbi:MAG TPA: acyl-CoA reductase [Chitinophagaceae bacterium]|nr:acyl-CoA reductase [Chitinophagaceae bacterium]